MAFKKGNEWNGNRFGRPKGASNRSSEMQKVNIQRMINEGLDYIKEDYHNIRKDDPAKAVTLLLKMMEYSLPKLKSVDMTLEADIKKQIEHITVNITDGDTSKHDKDISEPS
jgi:hypothetical protein